MSVRLLEGEARRENFSRDIEIIKRVLSGETYRSVGLGHNIGPERVRMITNTTVRRVCRYKKIMSEWPNLRALREDAGFVGLLNEFIGQVYAIKRLETPPWDDIQ
jgi:hypothetical protein